MLRGYYFILWFILLLIVPSGSLFAQLTGANVETRNISRSGRSNFFALQRQDALDNNITYNESIYIMSNYSGISPSVPEVFSVKELLQREVEGFYFYLRQDPENQQILLRNPNGLFSPFMEALYQLKDALDGDTTKVITLFLDFYVDPDLEQIFEAAGLSEYLLEYDTGSGWPTIKQMVQAGKRLVVFEMQKHLSSPGWLHNLNEFATGLSEPYFEQLNYGIESFDEKLRKSLFVFTGYKSLSLPEESADVIVPYARQTPYLIEAFKKAWISEGKVPNFIFIDRYYSWVTSLLSTFRQFHLVQGAITNNNEYLNYVNWQGMANYTSGKFCFPLESSGQLTLSPLSPGYEIMPKTIRVTNSTKKVYVHDFTAKQLNLDEQLEIYLPLDNNTKDFSYRRNHSSPRNIEFVDDPIRGQVASFGVESRIDLPQAETLHMRDHDFTVTAWVRIPRFIPEKTDYCILGTKNNAYQQGLHFLIRERKPYMGFFNNDLAGNTILEAGKWYHLTWRYNKINGEQAIFVDGKLDAISLNRPAYLGSDSLYIGHADMNRTFQFIGVLDNLCIWSRVLSDKEILGLSNHLVELNFSTWARLSRTLSLPILLLLIVLFIAVGSYLFYALYARKRKKTGGVTSQNPVFREIPDKNYIQLFGDFYVTNSDGENITALFTPKLKQLFLLILLYSQQDKSGISSHNLTKMIWGEDTVKSTKSLRSVSILKLRKILEQIDQTEIVFNTNKYAIVFSGQVYCDYLVSLQLIKGKKIKTKEEFERFYEIIGQGEIFKGESFDWLDDFKGDISNSIVDIISRFIGKYSLTEDTDKIIQMADYVLLNDPSNEEALIYKVKALTYQNNTKSAKYTYDKFRSLYQEMYGEEFTKTYTEIASTELK
ncbi:LamG-like jellyroll fold domain-containing protein [Parabacteroides sp. PF5-9]|uniref:LamG-like jellyroll fold domain-containing protein n=1 Tax=Parabacteroides sp. PF5-9 TaxID=1742404 RepID=UPI00247706F3|nr:LamG-like jellyroll fold domain-containing protein [Parabacteroides sp. PF5-9]MDH6356280.1 two-component SAPR family response regulator [Parabacteroides sp. PF5-9]